MKTRLICNKNLSKNDIKKLINWFLNNYGSIRTHKLLDRMKNIGFNIATELGISLGLEDLKATSIKKIIVKNTEQNIKKQHEKLIKGKINIIQYYEKKNEMWNKTNNILTSDIIKNFQETNPLNPAYMMIISGARGNLSQIKQLIGMRGIVADAEGKIIKTPIKKNLKEGIDLHEYFISCYGARKGIIDTALKTANSGYLTRKLIYVAQQEIIKKTNCNTNYKMVIKNSKKEKKYYKKLKNKILGRVLAKNIIININGKVINLGIGQDICRYIMKKIAVCKKIYFRTPLNCLINTGTCQLCYGWNLGNGRMVNLGETIGIIAAQSIGEPGTQLTMRTFHTGGIVNVKTKETIISPCDGIIVYKAKGKLIETKHKEKGILTTTETKVSLIPAKGNKLTINLPKYSMLFIKNKEKVKFKQIISEKANIKNLDKKKRVKAKILKLKSQISGIIKNKKKYIQVKIGNILNFNRLTKIFYKTKERKMKKSYKLINLNQKPDKSKIFDQTKNSNLKRYRALNKIKKKIQILQYKHQKTYTLNHKIEKKKLTLMNKINSRILIYNTKLNKRELEKMKNVNYKYNKKNIELISSEIHEKTKNFITLIKTNIYKLEVNERNYINNNKLIKKKNSIGNIKYKIDKIKDIVEGLPKIQQILESNKNQKLNERVKKIFSILQKKYTNKVATKKSLSLMQEYILKRIKVVYSAQGVNVNEKHFEIIIKQMTSKVIIKKTGDSNLLNSEIIYLNKIEKINKNIENKAKYEPIIIGISKFIKINDGFLCSASFQETTNIIAQSAIEGKIDWLTGLKENIILGNLIPAGTGQQTLN